VTDVGYALSSEEHGPSTLVENARRAEAAGFDFAMLSDHYHPWIERQGESPLAWTVLGGIARATEDLRVGTGVTCPTMRIHPAVIAQAAATTAAMFDGRFVLGVGTGERLNEHVVGTRWPPHHVRLEMLAEALTVIRDLWGGEMTSHDGEHYTVENAKLFTLPEEPPDVAVAAGGPETATFAGEHGDAVVCTAPESDLVDGFADAGGGDGDRFGQVAACWAEDEATARETVTEWWPNGGLPGELGQELATPKHFEQATELVSEEAATEHVPCGPDPQDHVEAIEEFVDAGFDHVYVHQVGPEQEGFLDFYESEVLPAVS
jgi:G6PDH family F420-dependent oxidoreductase